VEPVASSISRRSAVLLVSAAAAAVVVLIVSAALLISGGDDPDAEPSAAVRYGLEIRRVQSSVPGDCEGPTPAPAVFCDGTGTRYTLGPPELDGTQVRSVDAKQSTYDDGQGLIRISLDETGAATFAQLTTQLSETGQEGRVAVVVDGQVVTAPLVTSPITEGQIDISGAFSKSDAEDLVARMSS
jgi:hypothetical protein